jgi:hypothetical protein
MAAVGRRAEHLVHPRSPNCGPGLGWKTPLLLFFFRLLPRLWRLRMGVIWSHGGRSSLLSASTLPHDARLSSIDRKCTKRSSAKMILNGMCYEMITFITSQTRMEGGRTVYLVLNPVHPSHQAYSSRSTAKCRLFAWQHKHTHTCQGEVRPPDRSFQGRRPKYSYGVKIRAFCRKDVTFAHHAFWVLPSLLRTPTQLHWARCSSRAR